MCFGYTPSGGFTPPPLPPAPPAPVTEVDPAVQRAREEQRRKSAAMAGYGSTIATSGLGVGPLAPNTTAGFKALLGT